MKASGNKTMKNAVRLTLSLGMSALFLWIAFRGVDFATLTAALRNIHMEYVGLYVVTLVFIQFARAFRWDILIRPFARVDFRALMRISNLGNMLIMVLPLRLGELARPYLLKREAGARITAGMGAVVVERAIDGLLVTLLFFLTTYDLGEPYHVPQALRVGAFVALGIFAGATAVIGLALATHGWVPRMLRRLGGSIAPGLTEKLVHMLDAFVSGLRSLPDVRSVAIVVFWTLAYWAANALGLFWVARAFGWDLPFVAGFTVVCVVVIGIMIPAGPGFLGTYQGAIIAGLSIYGINKTDALAFSLVAYPINLAVVVGFGLPYLFGRNHVEVGEIVRASAEGEDAEASEAPPGK
ncbi:MAG TPA: lysylphosphatidylglycerol synthase transmembrane domain-containing protein [Myxococcota bacterium]|nr:lysylphosphatidylglycerol synthase transmembrane domain-containing protein [Myxococcota bacterium]